MKEVLDLKVGKYEIKFDRIPPIWSGTDKKGNKKYGYAIHHNGTEKVMFITESLNKEIEKYYSEFKDKYNGWENVEIEVAVANLWGRGDYTTYYVRELNKEPIKEPIKEPF